MANDLGVTAGQAKCKIALIRGSFIAVKGSVNNEPTPPIGLAYLAGTLLGNGYQVQGIDAVGEALFDFTDIPDTDLQFNGLNNDQIINMIEPGVRIIGISAMFSHEWTYCRGLINDIKEAFPNAVIIGGGEHFTALGEYSLRSC